MNPFILYLLLLKASVTSFSGIGALPIIREELVVNLHVLTDQQLNTAMVAGRLSPGPLGTYIVSIGYTVSGIPGAIAAWLAMATPSLLVIPILRYVGSRAESPRVRDSLDAVVLASVGLMLAALRPMLLTSVTGPLTFALALCSCALLMFTRIHTALLILAASGLMVIVSFF